LAGNPAKIIKQVSDEMIGWKSDGTRIYQQLAVECHHVLKACEPLREMPKDRKELETTYKTWNDTKK
jgi:hypothetical protein